MAFYRHFCERGDFEIMVITDNPLILEYKVPYKFFIISRGKLWKRITTTRFYKIGHTFGHFFSREIKDAEILFAIQNFAPQAVFTVAGSWSWMALLARKTALNLNVPLIGSFNDWWFYNLIRLKLFDKFLNKQFKNFYKKCDLSICTSVGMMRELGDHKNAVVIYPTGATKGADNGQLHREHNAHFIVSFAGNLGEWYGTMLQSLISANNHREIIFRIYGSNATWPEDFDRKVRETGIYQGQVSFDVLKEKICTTNSLLLLMGFDRQIAMVEKTSFKTKFLDYIAFNKPILLWGPEYCSAVSVARTYDSAEICTSENVNDFLNTIISLKNDPERQEKLITNANLMYAKEFNPDLIHSRLKMSIENLINNNERGQNN